MTPGKKYGLGKIAAIATVILIILGVILGFWRDTSVNIEILKINDINLQKTDIILSNGIETAKADAINADALIRLEQLRMYQQMETNRVEQNKKTDKFFERVETKLDKIDAKMDNLY